MCVCIYNVTDDARGREGRKGGGRERKREREREKGRERERERWDGWKVMELMRK